MQLRTFHYTLMTFVIGILLGSSVAYGTFYVMQLRTEASHVTDHAILTRLHEGVIQVSYDGNALQRIPGSVNGRQVKFLIDTGASLVTISRKAADRMGIQQCAQIEIIAVSGPMRGCLAHNATISLPGMEIRGADIAIVDYLEEDQALLGMNVMRLMNMTWTRDGYLRIS